MLNKFCKRTKFLVTLIQTYKICMTILTESHYKNYTNVQNSITKIVF